MLAVYDVVGARGDALPIEGGEFIGPLPRPGAVSRVVEAREAAAAGYHPKSNRGIGRREVEPAWTFRSFLLFTVGIQERWHFDGPGLAAVDAAGKAQHIRLLTVDG